MEVVPEFSMTLIGILIVTTISAIIILSRSNNILKIHRSQKGFPDFPY
jgi:hypothetical protein